MTPATSTRYLMTDDGAYLHRSTPLFTATVPVDWVASPRHAALRLHMPRLPVILLERAVSFFRAVYERWEGEAILILFYAPPAAGCGWRFALDAPPQLLPGRFEAGRFRAELRLEYGVCPRPGPEFLKLGTFHSHANVAAGHSSTDRHDELYESGLHVTAGRVHTGCPGFSAAFVVGRTRFSIPVDDVLPPFRTRRRFPPRWLEQVTVVREAPGDTDRRQAGDGTENDDVADRPAS